MLAHSLCIRDDKWHICICSALNRARFSLCVYSTFVSQHSLVTWVMPRLLQRLLSWLLHKGDSVLIQTWGQHVNYHHMNVRRWMSGRGFLSINLTGWWMTGGGYWTNHMLGIVWKGYSGKTKTEIREAGRNSKMIPSSSSPVVFLNHNMSFFESVKL